MNRALLVRNASEICLPHPPPGRGVDRLPKTALLALGGVVAWIGPASSIPADAEGAEIYDADGGAILPALVDAHTHLIWAGDRIEDFARRARGLSYTEIAREGGGILTTVHATRLASELELTRLARSRLEARKRNGIGTSEVKSGYGLSIEHELRTLEVVRALKREGYDLEPTLLALHAVPSDLDRDAYVDQVVNVMIPTVAREGLARFVDAFVERGAYTTAEAARVFSAATAHGLYPRLHADQITSNGGAELAASVGAVSADHLEHVSDEGIAALAKAGVIATLLPGALTYLGDHAPRLGRRLVDGGVEVAVATDANPGTSPTHNLPLMATLAVVRMGLTAEEALRAITLGAARALRRADLGDLRPGARARFIVLDHPDSRALIAAYGEPIVRALVSA